MVEAPSYTWWPLMSTRPEPSRLVLTGQWLPQELTVPASCGVGDRLKFWLAPWLSVMSDALHVLVALSVHVSALLL